MVEGLETLDIDLRISSLLKNDVQLTAALGGKVRLHADRAPENESHEFWVTFEMSDGGNIIGVGAQHIMSVPTYIIRVCVRDKGYQALRPAARRINELLKEGPGESGDTWVGRFINPATIRGMDELKNLRVYWIALVYTTIAYPRPA